MDTVVIVGAGQIGSRHLQGLSRSRRTLQISVVDPNSDSLALAEQRMLEMPNGNRQKVEYLTDLSSAPKEIDLAIVATSSSIRLSVLQDLTSECDVGNIVLEKFLFPRLSEFDAATELIAEAECKAWVNCPRRMMMSFKNLPDLLSESGPWSFAVTGMNWGLASNAVHLLDIFAMYTGSTKYDIEWRDSKPECFESKRNGFVEFAGTLGGVFGNAASFDISCIRGEDWKFLNRFSRGPQSVICDYATDHFVVVDDKEIEIKRLPFQIERQSDLTGRMADEILSTGRCDLPEYTVSQAIHQPLLKAFLDAARPSSTKIPDDHVMVT